MPIRIFYDNEANVWIAISENIGLVLESESHEALMKKVEMALPEMLAANNVKN